MQGNDLLLISFLNKLKLFLQAGTAIFFLQLNSFNYSYLTLISIQYPFVYRMKLKKVLPFNPTYSIKKIFIDFHIVKAFKVLLYSNNLI